MRGNKLDPDGISSFLAIFSFWRLYDRIVAVCSILLEMMIEKMF